MGTETSKDWKSKNGKLLRKLENPEVRLSDYESKEEHANVQKVDPLERQMEAMSKQESKADSDISELKGELNP